MRFIINKIEYESNLIIVTGNTSIGSLKGIWIYAQPPVIEELYHIELTIYSLTQLEMKQNKKLKPSIYLSGDTITFKGICEDIDSDVYFLRFDIDWIEMIEIVQLPCQKKIGEYIFFSANYHDIKIFPYTI